MKPHADDFMGHLRYKQLCREHELGEERENEYRRKKNARN